MGLHDILKCLSHNFVKHYAKGGIKVAISYIKQKCKGQGYMVNALCINWNGLISWVCMPNIVNVEIFMWGVNFTFFHNFEFIAKISPMRKLHHDTDMKAQEQYALDLLTWGIKSLLIII